MTALRRYRWLAAALCAPACSAQTYPAHPIRMIVPFSPGGTSDTLARILGQKMTEAWGQQVVVDSRPGASGIIGTEVAMRAPADGYTLMHGNLSQFAINPALFSKLGYDTLRDFVPLSLVGSAPQLLVVNPQVAATSLPELIQLAKAKPGALNFGSGGAGTLAYLGGEMFKAAAGVNIVHISYKGTVLALNDLVGGQVQLMFSDMPIAVPHAKSGKLRALAVTGAERTPLVPGMPTVAESGLPGYALDNWWGILAPRGVPQEIIARLNAEIVRIHKLPEVRERYAGLGVEALSSTSRQFVDYIQTEAARYGKLLKAAGAKVD
ncbi:MAG: tripartite tricarboxylate transporter substrate binding protein [Burkholderiales bacterium]